MCTATTPPPCCRIRLKIAHVCNHRPPVCNSEQAAYETLGYTQASWDNLSGEELLPWSSIKPWTTLTANEKAAAAFLGYNAINWDDLSDAEPQPASFYKHWDELTTCDDGKNAFTHPLRVHSRCHSYLYLPTRYYGRLKTSVHVHVCVGFMRAHPLRGGIVD